MSLLIEQLTKEASENTETGVEKTAEEVAMEKLAHEINVLDQSRMLVSVGEQMYKIAQELDNENFAALAVDTYQLGERMGSVLTKTASEDGSALLEALEIAEDMNKVASIYAELADETNDESLCKMAEAIIAISNELTEDANEVYKMASEEEEEEVEDVVEDVVEEEVEKEASLKSKVLDAFNKARKTSAGKVSKAKDYVGETASKATASTKDAFKADKAVKFWKSTDKDTGVPGTAVSLGHRLKQMAGTKEGLKSMAPAAVAYGSSAAALAAAGYGAKKLHDKKK